MNAAVKDQSKPFMNADDHDERVRRNQRKVQKGRAETWTKSRNPSAKKRLAKVGAGREPSKTPLHFLSLWLKHNVSPDAPITNEQMTRIYLLLDVQQSVVVLSPEHLLPVRLVPTTAVSALLVT
jgi:hypothetical protein